MNRHRLLSASLLVLVACASGPRVSVERSAGNALARYELFALEPDQDSATADAAFGPSARRAAGEEVELSLRQRGFRLVHPEDAEFLVRITTDAVARTEVGDRGGSPAAPVVTTRSTGLATPVGVVPTGQRTTVSRPAPTAEVDPPRAHTDRTIVIDVFDAETKDLLWRGTSLVRSSSAKLDEKRLLDHVRAIAARFPAS